MTPKTFAEQKVMNELATGELVVVGCTVPPANVGGDRRVRASFVRWLITGSEGAPPLHAKGLRIQGAMIEGDGTGADTPGLDLEGCTLSTDLALVYCRVPDPILLRSARVRNLFLMGSRLVDIEGDLLQADDGVSLNGTRVVGTVRLCGARIGGMLDCENARFDPPPRDVPNAEVSHHAALNANQLRAEGDVLLRNAIVKGTVHLTGARVDGNLSCVGATLQKPDANVPGFALRADGAQVAGGLLLRKSALVDGALDLSAAQFGHINDEPDCWPGPSDLLLDRCTYGAFTRGGVSASARLKWLALQDPARFSEDFWPQPWEQCAKVLREMGHAHDARAILIDKERRLREDRRRIVSARLAAARHRLLIDSASTEARPAVLQALRAAHIDLEKQNARHADLFSEEVGKARVFRRTGHRQARGRPRVLVTYARAFEHAMPFHPVQARIIELWTTLLLRSTLDAVLNAVVAYGYKSQRALIWAAGFWLLGAGIFAWVDGKGGMMPNNSFILRSAEWIRCAAPKGEPIELSITDAEGKGHETTGLRAPDERASDCFHRQAEGWSYPRFEPISYAADTLIPFVELHQQEHWTPNREVSAGWWGRGYLWLHIILGWALSLLAVAGFSGLVKSD